MKAEHRKQLQTNVLADRVGKLVQGLKTRPQKRTVFYVLLAIAVVAAVVIWLRVRKKASDERSMLWADFENGAGGYIQTLAGMGKKGESGQYADTNVGKAARFQYAFIALWELSIKRLPNMPRDVVLGQDKRSSNLDIVKSIYSELYKQCEEDKLWGAEARYNLAVIEETMAVKDRGAKEKNGHLTKARMMYLEVASKFPKSIYSKLAEKKAKDLAPGPELDKISQFYENLATEVQKGH